MKKIYLYIIFKIKVYKKYKSSNQEKKKQIKKKKYFQSFPICERITEIRESLSSQS